MRPRANLEQVKDGGLVSGWSWDERQPDRAVRLIVVLDGQPVGTTVADHYRIDLEQAGMGNGCHAFTYLIPWELIAAKSVVTIGLIDEARGEALDTTLVYRRPVVLTVEDRLRDVEQQLRLLAARLDETAARAARDAAMMGGVFATIGAFFTRLAELPPEAVPVELGHGIAGLLESTRARCAPFSFAEPAAPLLTLCVDGTGQLETIYGCLRRIHETGLDRAAEIVLVDEGRADQAALLPSLIGNLRYWRLQPGQSLAEARNRAVLPAARPFAAFLSAACRVTQDWLAAVQESFAGQPEAAIIGMGLEGGPRAPEPLADLLAPEDAAGLNPVAAVLDAAMVIRGTAFAALGGFDTGFVEATAAAVDLCLRAREEGYGVYHQPEPALLWRDEGGYAGAAIHVSPDMADLLAYRAASLGRQAGSEPLGRTLVMAGPAPDAPALFSAIAGLQAQGQAVSVAFTEDADVSDSLLSGLNDMGCSIIDAAEATGFDLLYLAPDAAGHPDLARLGTIAPRVVLALGAVAEEGLWDSGHRRRRIKDQLAAIAASDRVLIRSAAGAARLAALGFEDKLWRIGAMPQPGFADRSGLWLALGAEDAASRDGARWFARSILPVLAKALPDLAIHARRTAETEAIPGLALHDDAEDRARLLGCMRLALSPLRRAGGDTAPIDECRVAHLPVVTTEAVFDDPPPGVLLSAARPQSLLHDLLALLETEAEWRKLHDAIAAEDLSGLDRSPAAEDFAVLLRQLGLPMRDSQG